MHYPPETSSIMLMAKMVAIVKQVSLLVLLLLQIVTSCNGNTYTSKKLLKYVSEKFLR